VALSALITNRVWFVEHDVSSDLHDKLVELRALPIALNVSCWFAEIDVEQLRKDHAHRTLWRPGHLL